MKINDYFLAFCLLLTIRLQNDVRPRYSTLLEAVEVQKKA